MDTLTHALTGVLAGRALLRSTDRRQLALVATAAAFPDIDYLLILVTPMEFLNLHRGPTHSLVLLPLWAALLAWPLSRLLELRWQQGVRLCALGLLMHILGDWVTLYGTRLWYPLSDHAYALRASFDINPWIAAVALAGVMLGTRWRTRTASSLSLCLIGALLGGQWLLGQQALAVAAAQVATPATGQAHLHALPQPLSPFHWALVAGHAKGYVMTYLDLQPSAPAIPLPGRLAAMAGAYRDAASLRWTRLDRVDATDLSHQVWQHPGLAPFRRFATLPALLAIEQTAVRECVWFTDLRHRLPVLPSAFRYGMCRASGNAPWRPYRLRYLSTIRQPL